MLIGVFMNMRNSYPYTHRPAFPTDLAVKIARKASIMASRLEEQATRAMVRDAQRALDRGVPADTIAREMGLPAGPATQGEGQKSEGSES